MKIDQLLPEKSILHLAMQSLSVTEVPKNYQAGIALSVLGSLFKRRLYVDQQEWQVYPNLSVMLVGPSGIGKDIAIRWGVRQVKAHAPSLILGGKTIEFIQKELVTRPAPACAVIPAPEMTAFFGKKDYQSSMIQDVTDMLSTGDEVDVSLASVGVRVIRQPTITMWAGSTQEWIHKAMPEGSLEGGFFPRFLILCEEYGGKFIPWVKYSNDPKEVEAAKSAKAQFTEAVKACIEYYEKSNLSDIPPSIEAIDLYEKWYRGRFKIFPPSVIAYANRSRDQVLRVALISAISQFKNTIDAEDIQFGCELINTVALKVAEVVQPLNIEGRIRRDLLALLPMSIKNASTNLYRAYTRRDVLSAINSLLETGVIRTENGRWVRSE